MNFLKPLVATLLIIMAPVILESCCFDSCGSCFSAKDGPPHYDFTGLTMNVYTRDQNTEVTATPIKLSNLLVAFSIEGNHTSMMNTFGSAAYACSPAPEIANQKITSILITSNNDMKTDLATISKGEDLSMLFQIETEMRAGEISGSLNRQFQGRLMRFVSNVDVNSLQSHILTFLVTLDNGEEFEMTTMELNLKVN